MAIEQDLEMVRNELETQGAEDALSRIEEALGRQTPKVVAALYDERDALKAEVEQLRAERDGWITSLQQVEDERDVLEAGVERYKADQERERPFVEAYRKSRQELERLRAERANFTRQWEVDGKPLLAENERLRKFETLWNDRVEMVDDEVERLREQGGLLVEALDDKYGENKNLWMTLEGVVLERDALKAEVERLRGLAGFRENGELRREVERLQAELAQVTEWNEKHLDEVERLRAESDYNYAEAEKVPKLIDEVERLRDLLNKDPDVDWQEMAKMLDEKDQEVERLRNSNSRLRKAVNWMRGCFDQESWEYKRATVVLEEEK